MQAEICHTMLLHIFIKNSTALKMSASIKEKFKDLLWKVMYHWEQQMFAWNIVYKTYYVKEL
jgi:hypothetical protein